MDEELLKSGIIKMSYDDIIRPRGVETIPYDEMLEHLADTIIENFCLTIDKIK